MCHTARHIAYAISDVTVLRLDIPYPHIINEEIGLERLSNTPGWSN